MPSSHPFSAWFWFAQPGPYAKEVRRASHKVPVQWIGGGRTNLYHNCIVPGGRFFNLLTLKEDIGRTVAAINNGLHGFLSDQEAAASNGCTLAPLIRSHSAIANSPKRTGKVMRETIS